MQSKLKKRDKRITREVHKLFWRGMLQRRGMLFAAYSLRLTSSALLNAIAPLFAALGVQAILDHQPDEVYANALIVIAVSALYAILSYIGSLAVARASIAGSNFVTREVFENFLNKDYEFYTNRFSGSLGEQVSRLRTAYMDYCGMAINIVSNNIATFAVSLVIVAIYSVELALVTLIIIAIILYSSFAVSNKRRLYRRMLSQANSDIAGHVGDALSHGDTVKSFSSGDVEMKLLDKPIANWARYSYKTFMSFELFNAPRAMLTAFAVACLLIVSMWLYDGGQISAAIVVLVQIYVIRLVLQTIMLNDLVKQYEHLMSNAYDPVATMLVGAVVNDAKNPKSFPSGPLTLTLNDVTFHYNEAKAANNALRNITIAINPGEKIGLVGHSGSGKTTLSKLLLRFMDVTEGSIKLGDIDIRQLRQSDLRRAISYVPQEPLLFHRSIAENIAYGKPDASQEEIITAAKHAYIDEFIDELPEKYDTMVGERGVKLSGGQRQRVAIARALLKDAPLLVLDEATSALDSKSEKYIQNALWKLMQGRTAIVIAHRLSTIQRMDKIIVLDKGVISQIGTHEELKNVSGIYADLWNHQSGGYIGDESSDLIENAK